MAESTIEDLTRRLAAAESRAVAAEKETFFANMRAVSSSSAAGTSSRSDEESRRGAPLPSVDAEGGGSGDDDGFITECGFPEAEPAAVTAAWAAFRAQHERLWAPPAAGAPFRENAHMHPSIGWAWRAAAHDRSLRVWGDAPAPDDVPRAHVRPDFAVTSARDAALSTIGALLLSEVKRPGRLDAAAYQLRAYLRRRVYKLCSEADARGEALDGIVAFGAATDGASVVVARVASGAPAPGASFARAVPCPVRQSRPLRLFGAWDFTASPPPFWADAAPPAGFRALWRLCAAPQLLGGAAALESLRVALRFEHGDGASDATTMIEVLLKLDERLGSGGTSDVYAVGGGGAIASVGSCEGVAAATAAVAAAVGGDHVLKVSRVATAEVVAEFDAERRVLCALRGDAAAVGRVPVCVAHGVRLREASHSLAGVAEGAAPWPVLLLHPRGQPLIAWVAARVAVAAQRASGGDAAAAAGGAGAGPEAAAAAARRACADAAARNIVSALSAAHAHGFMHCDVRPGNVVVAEGDVAVLVDWGLACRGGTRIARRGVAAFADSRVFLAAAGVAAAPALDALAALYTWLAIACGDGGAPPWARAGAGADDEIIEARQNWLEEMTRAAVDARVADVARCALLLQNRPLNEAATGGEGGGGGALDLARRVLEGGL